MVPATATRVAFFQTLCYTIASNFVAWGQGALKNQLIGYHTVAQIEYEGLRERINRAVYTDHAN